MSEMNLVEQYLQYLKHVRHLSENTIVAYRRDMEAFADYLRKRGESSTLSAGGESATAQRSSTLSAGGESATAQRSATREAAGESATRVRGPAEAGLDEATVRGFVADCTRKGLSSRSANRVLSALRGYYRFLQKFVRDEGNPFREVRSLRTDKPLPSFLFEKEVERLLDREAVDFWQLRDRLILEMLYSTGCRVSELTAIDLDALAPNDGSLRVMGKGGKERLVFLGRQARELLREYLLRRRPVLIRLGRERDQQALLVNRRGGRLTSRGVQVLLAKFVAAAGIDKTVTPHTFRHSFATHILNRGADIRVVQELLGHASLSTTQVYTHLDVEGLRRVYQRAHPHARLRHTARSAKGGGPDGASRAPSAGESSTREAAGESSTLSAGESATAKRSATLSAGSGQGKEHTS